VARCRKTEINEFHRKKEQKGPFNTAPPQKFYKDERRITEDKQKIASRATYMIKNNQTLAP
jgi:DeoR/GlpR family transcriptional regulator of sugar metabolism